MRYASRYLPRVAATTSGGNSGPGWAFVRHGRPKSRGIRRERFIDPNKLVLEQTKLKFSVRQQNPSRLRVRRRAAVDFQADVAHCSCTLISNQRGHPFKRNVLVMPGRRLRCRRENRLWQAIRLSQAVRQRNAADCSGPLSILPSSTRNLTAHHALNRQWRDLPHQHRTPCQFLMISVKWRRKFRRAKHMIWNHIAQQIKPEQRKLR